MLGLYLAHTWHFGYLVYTLINRTTLWFCSRNEVVFSRFLTPHSLWEVTLRPHSFPISLSSTVGYLHITILGSCLGQRL